MKLFLLKPFARFASSFIYTGEREEVIAPDSRMYYIKNGELSITLYDGEHILKNNSIFYSKAGIKYKLSKLQKGTLIYSINFDLTQEYNDDITPRYPMLHNKIVTNERQLPKIAENDSFLADYKIFNDCQEYFMFFEKIVDLFLDITPLKREYASVLINELLVLLHFAVPQNKEINSKLCISIKNYLDEHYKEDISLKSLAKHFCYNENYLNRIFASAYKTSIIKYVIDKRTTEAKRLILSTNLSFNDISEKVGFKDYAYFSTRFRSKTGLSPREYKKQSKILI